MDHAAQETERIESLHSYAILDTPPDELFDQLTRLTSAALGVPISLVSLIDERRQWFKSRVGLGVSETARELAFCDHAIRQEGPFIVANASEDQRFATNPLVTEAPHIRFYAGIPICSPDGHGLGTLCIIDRIPRELTEAQVDLLQRLARLVGSALEMHRKSALLERSLTDLDQQKQSTEMLAAMVVHDMRGPITTILGLAELEASEAIGQAAQSLMDIVVSAERLQRMTLDILDICLAGAGQLKLRTTTIDLADLVGNQVRLLGQMAQRANVALRWQPIDGCKANVDPDLIARVVVNLLDNAIRHSPHEQSVEIDLSRDASGFTVKIHNQGPTLLAEDIERVFEPLVQAANNPHRRHHFGLGLAFCKLAMEAHEGRVWAESSLEGGNTFAFTLPSRCSAA